jgi:hypothetical protein
VIVHRRLARLTPRIVILRTRRVCGVLGRLPPLQGGVGENQCGNEVDEATGDPHDESGELLVFGGRESAWHESAQAHFRIAGVPGAR